MKKNQQQLDRPGRFTRCGLRPLLGTCVLAAVAGCQSFGGGSATRGWFPRLPFGSVATDETETPPLVQAEDPPRVASGSASNAGGTLASGLPSTNRLVGYVTGKKHEDIPKAKELYRRGDERFKQAARAPKATRTGMFAEAAELFEKACKEAPGSGLNQDALFMQGESLFFANDLNGARDAFEELQKDFPRNRHGDRAAARLFSISKYWIDVSKAGDDAWYSLNLFDTTRPLRDADGHAVRVLDQIRYDDPTGKLADDATMAAAAEHIRNEQYEKADEFLTDLRETFTDSDHLFLAHLLGIRCKLEIYGGPEYSELVLDEADELVKQTRRRFPNELREEKYNQLLARAAAEIAYHKAEKLAFRAKYRERKKEYGAAAQLYRKILRDHPTTPQADRARDVLARIDDLPATPTQNFAIRAIAKAFPSAKRSTPLVTVDSVQPTEETSEESPADAPSETTGKKLLR
ncbi:tetratricopeptide repeat protein [Rhodopirellula sp. JC639]|uniref:tetratricopeptide repeat protein n=1 Tax=Stieleria mannarensis TaxID=2755585 RepID=UPI001602B139|nr:tetratricopeptide repeat protein [Rhodopirellula sp. JC639]